MKTKIPISRVKSAATRATHDFKSEGGKHEKGLSDWIDSLMKAVGEQVSNSGELDPDSVPKNLKDAFGDGVERYLEILKRKIDEIVDEVDDENNYSAWEGNEPADMIAAEEEEGINESKTARRLPLIQNISEVKRRRS